MENANCNVELIQDEWISFEVMVNTSFKDKDYVELWKVFPTKSPYKEAFKNILEILLPYPFQRLDVNAPFRARIASRVTESLCFFFNSEGAYSHIPSGTSCH